MTTSNERRAKQAREVATYDALYLADCLAATAQKFTKNSPKRLMRRHAGACARFAEAMASTPSVPADLWPDSGKSTDALLLRLRVALEKFGPWTTAPVVSPGESSRMDSFDPVHAGWIALARDIAAEHLQDLSDLPPSAPRSEQGRLLNICIMAYGFLSDKQHSPQAYRSSQVFYREQVVGRLKTAAEHIDGLLAPAPTCA